MTATQDATAPWTAAFAAKEGLTGAEAGDPRLAPLRREALDAFHKTGFPTTHDEAWRFTSVAPIERISFAPAPPLPAAAAEAPIEAVRRAALGVTRGPRLVFLDGRFSEGLSTLALDGVSPAFDRAASHGLLPSGARLVTLREALASDRGRPFVVAHLARHAAFADAPFAALNTAFLDDGAFLHIPDGVNVDEPILLAFLSTEGALPTVSHPRVLVIAGAGSSATIVETYGSLPYDTQDLLRLRRGALDRQVPAPAFLQAAGATLGKYFTNAVTEIVLGEDAAVEHLKLQLEAPGALHVATVAAHLARGSRYTSRSFSVGGALARNDVVAVLDGEGAECTLDGLYLASGTQHVDNHTTIDHARPHGTSRETYKGIMSGRARGVFDGRIIVRADAQKTDSRQVNRNLLLSDAALINTKPQLEINADDVKCAHAATIGRLDEAALFYLRSRGIGHDQARALLIEAFAGEVVGRIGIEAIRTRLSAMVHALATTGEALGIEEAA